MSPHTIFLLIALMLYLPLAGTLMYVWYKYGNAERFVRNARIVFIIGSVLIFWYMVKL